MKDPGDGYRLLAEGELILSSDEKWSEYHGTWIPVVISVGKLWKKSIVRIRRKCETLLDGF